MCGVAEPHRRYLNLAAPLDEHAIRAVDHDVGDQVVLQQHLQRAQAQHVVHQVSRQAALLAPVQLNAPLGGDIGDQSFHFQRQPIRRRRGDGHWVHLGKAQRAHFGQSGGVGLAVLGPRRRVRLFGHS